ncbi:uncharacterized protein LOC129759980 [Uranotaenia lowii]|uniref:uncharacterized protein LOC129759980 n=1 Tax=Uranotaenia lowii TaxID=190385 RepID=UPI00247A96ED|nr:uncharacterized protein LOC129759980 [Uranotaenia lowii]
MVLALRSLVFCICTIQVTFAIIIVLDSSQQLNRIRRDVSANTTEKKGYQVLTNVHQECSTKFGLPDITEENHEAHHDKISCTIECVMKKFNQTDENGTLRYDTLSVGQKWFWNASIADGFIDECFNQTLPYAQEFLASHSTECNPQAEKFGNCLTEKILAACQLADRKDSEPCASLLAKLRQSCLAMFPKLCKNDG